MKKITLLLTALVAIAVQTWSAPVGGHDAYNGYSARNGNSFGSPASAAISVNIDTLQLGEVTIGYSCRKNFMVYGENLQGDVTLSIAGRHASHFTITPSTITADEAAEGVLVTVKYLPVMVESWPYTLTLSSPGADDLVIPVACQGLGINATVTGHSASRTMEGVLGAVAMSSIVEVIRWADAEIPRPPGGEVRALPDMASGYSVSVEGDDCIGAAIIRSSSSIKTCDVRIFYHPTDLGPHHATVTVSCDRSWYDVVLTIEGNGVIAKSDPVILATAEDELTQSSFVAHWKQECPIAGVSSFTLECVPQNSEFNSFSRDYVVYNNLPAQQCKEIGVLYTNKVLYCWPVEVKREGANHIYRVKATYIDGTESEWSDVGTVVLSTLNGDMNGDGSLSVADIVMLINYILDGEDQTRGGSAADVNGDGLVNISDVSELISRVLNAV